MELVEGDLGLGEVVGDAPTSVQIAYSMPRDFTSSSGMIPEQRRVLLVGQCATNDFVRATMSHSSLVMWMQ